MMKETASFIRRRKWCCLVDLEGSCTTP